MLAYLVSLLLWHNPRGVRHVSLVVVDACSTASRSHHWGTCLGPRVVSTQMFSRLLLYVYFRTSYLITTMLLSVVAA